MDTLYNGVLTGVLTGVLAAEYRQERVDIPANNESMLLSTLEAMFSSQHAIQHSGVNIPFNTSVNTPDQNSVNTPVNIPVLTRVFPGILTIALTELLLGV